MLFVNILVITIFILFGYLHIEMLMRIIWAIFGDLINKELEDE